MRFNKGIHLHFDRAIQEKSSGFCCIERMPLTQPPYTFHRHSKLLSNLPKIGHQKNKKFQNILFNDRRELAVSKFQWLCWGRKIKQEKSEQWGFEIIPLATYWISPGGELRRNHLAISFFCLSLSSSFSTSAIVFFDYEWKQNGSREGSERNIQERKEGKRNQE